jgi:hypothetical protein
MVSSQIWIVFRRTTKLSQGKDQVMKIVYHWVWYCVSCFTPTYGELQLQIFADNIVGSTNARRAPITSKLHLIAYLAVITPDADIVRLRKLPLERGTLELCVQMAAVQANEDFVKRFYEWHPRFATRQKNAYTGQNESFDCISGPPIDDVAELISAFMEQRTGYSGSSAQQAELIRGFCQRAQLPALRAGTDPRSLVPIALLDERSEGGALMHARGICRPHDTPLSAQALYTELSKKVLFVKFALPRVLYIRLERTYLQVPLV